MNVNKGIADKQYYILTKTYHNPETRSNNIFNFTGILVADYNDARFQIGSTIYERVRTAMWSTALVIETQTIDAIRTR